jgi:hypothetical protein
VTAIGQPFEPVAPFIGTGGKMNTNWHFRSTISSSNDHVLLIDDAELCLQFPIHVNAGLLSGLGTTSTAQVSAPASERYPMLGSPLLKR